MLRRFARALLVGVLASYVVYVVGANVALKTRVLSSYLDDTEEEVRIHYASAWTWWPGEVRVEDLLVATQDSAIQCEVRAAVATGDVQLFGLFQRQFVIRDVRATHVTVRVRGRREEAEAIAAAPSLPPMVTWGALALKNPADLPKSDPDALWHIVLDDTAGTVDEVWVENVRITGAIRARGTFDFAPLKKVVIDGEGVRGAIRDGAVEVMGRGDAPFVDDVSGRFRFRVESFDVPSNELVDIVRFADIDADLDGMLHADRLTRAIGSDVQAVDGSGAFSVFASARQGRLLRGSRVSYDTSRLGIVGAPVEGDLRDATLDVLATSDEEMLTAATAATVDLRVEAAPESRIHVEAPTASFVGRMVPHFFKPTFEGGEANIPAANMGLAGLDGVAEGVRFRKGIAFARGHAKVDRDGRAAGVAHTRVEDVDAVLMGVGVTGRMKSEVHLDEARLAGDPSLAVRGFLALDQVDMSAGKERLDDWWARLEVGGRFARHGDQPWAIDADLLGRFRDAAPAVTILDGGDFVPGIIADYLTAEGLVAKVGLEVRGSRVQVDLNDATGKDLRMRGRMVATGDEVRGSYLVQTDVVDVGVSVVGGGTQVQLLAGEGWLERERQFLAGFARSAPKVR